MTGTETKSRSEIQAILSSVGIKCEWVAMDEFYILPSKKELQELLTVTFFEKYKYNIKKFDCNSFALMLTAFVTQQRYFKNDEYRWCLGMVCGYFPKFSPDYHGRNLAILDDGKVYLIEPQQDTIEEKDDKDNICFINYL